MGSRRRADRPGARTARPVPSAGAEPLNGAAARAALAGLAACAACFVTAESLPIGLLPQIAVSMRASLSLTGLLVTIYALVVVRVIVPLSHAMRAIPRRTVMVATAGTLAVGCLGCVLAPDYGLLLAARALTA
ncbi:MAG: hypothetical protein M0T77_04540 [Actinomycetota bacterium]|nr:hypothetical protein [Actinomycetota bacterium]